MSGDVQPRKRKDKRRKKEGGSLGSVYEPEIIHKHKKSESDHKSFELPDQGEKIHVQSEHGVGGNICVKIIFFCLFGLLVGAVGLIYLQSQGSTDVDLPTVEESRFAEYFTGWLDDSNDDHEHGDFEQDANEHEELEDHDEHDEHDEDEDDDHEKEDQNAEQESIFSLFGLHNKEEKDEPEESEMATSDTRESEELGIKDDKDEDEDLDDKEEDEDDEEQVNERDDEDEEEEEEEEEDDEKLHGEDDEDSGIENDEEDEDDASQVDENDDEENLDESEDADKEKDVEISREDKHDDEDGDEKEENKEQDESEEADQESEESEESEDEKLIDDLGYDEIYESEEDEDKDVSKQGEAEEKSDEGIEKSEMEEVEEEEEKATTFVKVESDAKEEDETPEKESGGVAVKLGVGIALVIVAHLVLVQKWKSMSNSSTDEMSSSEVKLVTEEKKNVENLTSDIEPVISRRQTLVPENVSLNDEWGEDEEELGEEEEEIDEEAYSEEEEVEEENIKKAAHENLESFEKLSWNEKKKKDKYEDDEYNEEIEEEEEEEAEDDREEEEEEEEEDVENEEEECDNEMEEEMENEYDEKKKLYVEDVESPREEVVHEEALPVPPPRSHKGGRGPQDFEEDFVERFEEVNQAEEKSQDEVDGDELDNAVEPEERKPVEMKPGNEDDWAFKQDFDFADEQFENNPKAAVEAFDKILAKKPTVVRALIGRARALDHLAEKAKSNVYLKQAISAYKSLLLEFPHLLDDNTFIKLSERCIERIRFSGAFSTAIDIHKALIMKFPQTPKYRNTLAVTYLMLNRIPQARALLNETLALWPEDGFALVHYGFILKTSDNNMEEGAKKLMAGIQTKQEGVIDGMFFFHLGDALNRLGRGEEAMKWYELGVKEGLFLSKYQRSLYNVNRLKGQPWWTVEETTYQDFFRKLEQNWREIRREGLELLNSKEVNLFKQETENLKDTGDWKQLDLYFRGKKQATCNKAPITCGLVSSFKPAATCTRGQIKFSVMLPETHVWPHCGPTNCRLRSHLGLVIPKKTYIKVAEETRSWEEGKFIIFDDSFEHEVWHNGTGLRLVLIVDVWHPELTNHERLTLSPI